MGPPFADVRNVEEVWEEPHRGVQFL